ncbi:unnamed protein product [Oikopleura dioica]|uniref:Uncharacterized protein n=1 Tax=Oikopleura dioica TaxID=34765 RepID=E4XET3_OIKDI|nr:unnamed protein product [Oikopleura dioica]
MQQNNRCTVGERFWPRNLYAGVSWPKFTPSTRKTIEFSLRGSKVYRDEPSVERTLVDYASQRMKLWNDLIPKMMQPLKKAKINFPSSSFIPEPTDETATIADDLKNMNNITIQSFEDKQKEEAEKEVGVGLEISVTLSIGLMLFIINAFAFLQMAIKKQREKKNFRAKIEDQIKERLIKNKQNNSIPNRVNKRTLGNDLRRSQLSSEGHKNYLSRKMSLERSQSPRKDSTGR